MKIVYKDTEIVQYKDVTLSYLESFYNLIENREKLILIYNGQEYWTVLDYHLLRGIRTQKQLSIFLDIDCCHECLADKNDIEWAEDIYKYTKANFIPVKSSGRIHEFIETALTLDENIYAENLKKLVIYLKQKNVSVYCIQMPCENELKCNIHSFHHFPRDGFMWRECNWELINKVLVHITDKDYEEAKAAALESNSLNGKVLGKGKRRIFLVGRCIVNGWVGFKGDEFATILSETLGEQYQIQCISMGRVDTFIRYLILEFDIKKSDLVICIDDVKNWCESAINVPDLFNSYEGDRWLYYDEPIHTTRYGNKLLSKMIAEQIVDQHDWNVDGDEDTILHEGRPMLSYRDEDMLKQYCDRLPKQKGYESIGAIVMNCNPFTLGHRFLIEQALQYTDLLYLFVVEEDVSEFSFEERFGMVQAGIADLKNVIPVPSGRFILSRESFRSYFEKEQLRGLTVDASKDLYIFTEYIVKKLGIQKRFVGEEPFDTVTRQYNLQMKKILGEAGIEVIEIPRKLAGDEIISASKVRKYLADGDEDNIKELVPQSTLEYLKHHADYNKKKNRRNLDRYEQKMIQNMAEFIRAHNKVVLYGTGRDAQGLLNCLSEEMIEKLEYCDRRAYTEQYEFMGKKVMSPPELAAQGRNVKILVSSTGYKYDIYDLLIDLGISGRNIMFNPVCFEKNKSFELA